MSMRYWLMKSEPGAFSVDDLARTPKKTTGWNGVRNYQARNFLQSMRVGDKAFLYHSNADPTAIVGTMQIVREAYPDPTQFDSKNTHYDAASRPQTPRWFQVDVRLEDKLKKAVTLQEIKCTPELAAMVLLKNGRLSVQPVTPEEWAAIHALSQS